MVDGHRKECNMPFKIIRQDIRNIKVDAIVNPSNSDLYSQGGLDGMIHKLEGSWLKEETRKYVPLKTGQVVLTKSKKLFASFIIHTVGPIYRDGNQNEHGLLKLCYENALKLAVDSGFESIAIPLISTGTYGFPKELALNIAVSTIESFLVDHELDIYLVVYDRASFEISSDLFDSVESYIEEHYVDEIYYRRTSQRFDYVAECDSMMDIPSPSLKKTRSLEELMDNLGESFKDMLFRLIDERGLKDSDVYKKANVTKQTFWKIKNKEDYTPKKSTVLALAIAIELSLDETEDLLRKVGYALSNSNKFDVIVSYFLESESYNIHEINMVLFKYDQELLGY